MAPYIYNPEEDGDPIDPFYDNKKDKGAQVQLELGLKSRGGGEDGETIGEFCICIVLSPFEKPLLEFLNDYQGILCLCAVGGVEKEKVGVIFCYGEFRYSMDTFDDKEGIIYCCSGCYQDVND
ncbi:MAG: hypothetical protein EZS28_001332 [Streblomastix strix]|uniref:Uncharacterized protein n=1 Tax=Streblomastix strix TaxID=222440 RepID=A0A5J4X7J4_9EUKA|nr:MAG: hypothetical protein EZS28_001332 [Streblomastix strix]